MPMLVLCSPVHGRLLVAGKPISKIKVVQRWQWLGEDDGTAETITDAKGRFQFPQVSRRSSRAPKDVLLIQDLEATYRGKTVSLWNLTRQDLEANGELGGAPIELTADLDDAPKEVKLPVGPGKRAIITGLATFRHPYLEQWERVRARLKPAGVGRALKAFLASPEGVNGLAAFFPAVGATHRRVAEIVSVSEVKLEDGALYAAIDQGRYALEETARFVGATTRAKVLMRLDSGEEVAAGFFAWAVLLPLDERGAPRWEAHFADRWEVDTRDWIRQQARSQLAFPQVAQLVRRGLQASPGAQVREAVGTGALTVDAVEVDSVEIDGVKDDWAILNALVRTTLRVGKRAEHPRVRAFLTVQLASLGGSEYRLSPGKDAPTFRPFRFGVTLTTDKPGYARGEKILLRFDVENLMGTPQKFLRWHTPFEGFRNDFLDVQPSGGGEPVPYQGILASRAPPGPSAYLTLAPGEKATSSIELTEAYPVEKPGAYVVRYKPLDAVWAGEARFSVRR